MVLSYFYSPSLTFVYELLITRGAAASIILVNKKREKNNKYKIIQIERDKYIFGFFYNPNFV